MSFHVFSMHRTLLGSRSHCECSTELSQHGLLRIADYFGTILELPTLHGVPVKLHMLAYMCRCVHAHMRVRVPVHMCTCVHTNRIFFLFHTFSIFPIL